MKFRRAGDGHDPWLLREQPGEGHLRGRRLLLVADALEQVDEGLILAHRFGSEARESLAEIAVGELGVLGHRARQETAAERAEGDETDAELFARGEDAVGFDPARPQRIFVLQRRDRLHGVRAADGLGTRLGHTEMPDLARGDELLDRAGHVLDRHVRVDPMLVEQVDEVEAEPLQRGVGHASDILGPAVHAVRLAVGKGEAELGSDHHAVAHGLERFADNLLVGERAVGFGGVEESDATFHRLAE